MSLLLDFSSLVCEMSIWNLSSSPLFNINRYCQRPLGAVHILRQPPEGGGGVSQKLTIADEGGRGGKPNADNC